MQGLFCLAFPLPPRPPFLDGKPLPSHFLRRKGESLTGKQKRKNVRYKATLLFTYSSLMGLPQHLSHLSYKENKGVEEKLCSGSYFELNNTKAGTVSANITLVIIRRQKYYHPVFKKWDSFVRNLSSISLKK